MSPDASHKSLALLATSALLLLLGFMIARHSNVTKTLSEYLKSPPGTSDAANTRTPLSLPDLIKTVKPSVVEITTYNSSDELSGLGSGFFTSSRQIISNWHVVDGCYRAEVKTTNGDIYPVKGILASDKEIDLVLLEVDIPSGKAHVLKVSANSADEGERVVVIGNPLGLEGTVSDGIISGIRDVPKLGRLLQLTAPISHGSSGGPVVNMQGEVIGVARGMLSEGQNLNFAVPSNEILSLKRGTLVSFAELRHQQAVEFHNQALALANAGSCNSAIPLLKQAVVNDPNYEDAWLQLGTCEFNTSRYEESLAAFREVIRINPGSEQAIYDAGRASAELELWDSAAKYYRQTIQLNPRNDNAQFGLGLVMCATGDIEGARGIYSRLMRVRSKRARELYDAYPEIVGEETP
jgi:Tfp pilus assembly protein PilF